MTSTRRTDHSPGPPPVRPHAPATAPGANPGAAPPTSRDTRMRAPSRVESEPWRLPSALAEAGPEIRRHVALRLRHDAALQRLESQFSRGQIDEGTYRALRKDCVDRAKNSTRIHFETAGAEQAGVSREYFLAKNHATLANLYASEFADVEGKLLQAVRWEVFGSYQDLMKADPEIGRLQAARQARVKALPPGSVADRDPAVGTLNAQIHLRENVLRLQAQDAFLQTLDSRLEIDAVTRTRMRDFVKQSQPGTLGSGVWKDTLATAIKGISHRPGEADATHAFIGVLPGLYYESVVEPLPEVSGVKPVTAVELFAGFHGKVRTQEISRLTGDQRRALYNFAISRQGTPYNTKGLLAGIPGIARSPEEDRAYYCAEFVGRALTTVGVPVWTRAGNTPFDGDNPRKDLLSWNLQMPLQLARTVPYTVAKIIAPKYAERMGTFGLTLDDALGFPRLSPQKLINGRINRHPLHTTFDNTGS